MALFLHIRHLWFKVSRYLKRDFLCNEDYNKTTVMEAFNSLGGIRFDDFMPNKVNLIVSDVCVSAMMR